MNQRDGQYSLTKSRISGFISRRLSSIADEQGSYIVREASFLAASSAWGSTSNQARAPNAHRAAATWKDAGQLKRCAMNGVRDAVTALPICPPMFMSPETVPAEGPAMSAVTDQYELCDRYNAPAPPASTMLASFALSTCVPSATKTAARPMPTAASPHRPIRLPYAFINRSLRKPPASEPPAIAMKGSIEYTALALRSRPRTRLK